MTFVGDEVPVEVLRDGTQRQVTLKIGEDELEKVRGRRIDRRLAGTQLQNFRNQDEPSMGAGVLVLDIDPDSDAYRFGLRPGDILVAANRRAIANLAELREVARLDDGQLLLRVYRSGQFGYVAIR